MVDILSVSIAQIQFTRTTDDESRNNHVMLFPVELTGKVMRCLDHSFDVEGVPMFNVQLDLNGIKVRRELLC